MATTMIPPGNLPQELPRAQQWTERAFTTLERFLRIEAVSGIALLVAAVIALVWANSSIAYSYHALWSTPLSFGLGDFIYSQSLHFWVNDVLMTVFFLVIGMEIRLEIHDGALSQPRQAALPVMAAVGGVLFPALVYLALNGESPRHQGWAISTATDIAFAVGVLALLGRSIPGNVRIFLLTLAIVDDIVAVLIIALFYSGGLDYSGFLVAGAGVLMVLALQQMGIGLAYAYIVPGAILWSGILMTGAHPSLAGVVLGLMTPVLPMRTRERPLDVLVRISSELAGQERSPPPGLMPRLRQLHLAQRELQPPAVRVQAALHPWVAFGVMPLFALANAGITLDGIDLSEGGAQWVMVGVVVALVIGKPLGIASVSWLMVRLGWCRMPPDVSWSGIWLISLLGGMGFTMSIFITLLAFQDDNLINAAKLGVLVGSLVAAIAGLAWGVAYTRRRVRQDQVAGTPSTGAAPR
jgi:NhaA family Na+:H+ antiporter